MLPNYARMFALIDEVFATRTDPEQLQVDQAIIAKLNEIHPLTLNELADQNGPVIWSLMIPTSHETMEEFVAGKISEQELYNRTTKDDNRDALYLCSVTTLPEHRGKGETKKLCLNAIDGIRQTYPIKSLFVWTFTEGGDKLARALSRETGLPLYVRAH